MVTSRGFTSLPGCRGTFQPSSSPGPRFQKGNKANANISSQPFPRPVRNAGALVSDFVTSSRHRYLTRHAPERGRAPPRDAGAPSVVRLHLACPDVGGRERCRRFQTPASDSHTCCTGDERWPVWVGSQAEMMVLVSKPDPISGIHQAELQRCR